MFFTHAHTHTNKQTNILFENKIHFQARTIKNIWSKCLRPERNLYFPLQKHPLICFMFCRFLIELYIASLGNRLSSRITGRSITDKPYFCAILKHKEKSAQLVFKVDVLFTSQLSNSASKFRACWLNWLSTSNSYESLHIPQLRIKHPVDGICGIAAGFRSVFGALVVSLVERSGTWRLIA